MPEPKTEKEFQISSDARTLQQASKIMKDKARFNAAVKYLAEEKEEIDSVIDNDGLMAAVKNNNKKRG